MIRVLKWLLIGVLVAPLAACILFEGAIAIAVLTGNADVLALVAAQRGDR